MTLGWTPAPHRSAAGPALRRTRYRAFVTLVVAAVLSLLGCGSVATPSAPISDTTLTKVEAILVALRTKSSDTDPRYYEGKTWHDGSPSCFRCTLGPAVLSAAFGKGREDTAAIATAIESFDLAVKKHQRPDGAIIPAAPGEGGPDIQTTMFTFELAQTYLILGADLDAFHRRQWSLAIIRAADFLIRNGNLEYYTNGNINLANTAVMDFAYRITKLTRFRSAAQRSLNFTLAPPQENKWAGFGLQFIKQPQSPDYSDGSGFLAESGANGPGFDAAYTMFQANIAANWYLLTGRQEALQLTNLFYNALWPRVRPSDWTIDVSGGTRRTAEGVRYRFYTPALPVLALRGGRTELEELVAPQAQSALIEYGGSAHYANPGISFNYGNELGAIVRVITTTDGW